jgi:hypothetical protein
MAFDKSGTIQTLREELPGAWARVLDAITVAEADPESESALSACVSSLDAIKKRHIPAKTSDEVDAVRLFFNVKRGTMLSAFALCVADATAECRKSTYLDHLQAIEQMWLMTYPIEGLCWTVQQAAEKRDAFHVPDGLGLLVATPGYAQIGENQKLLAYTALSPHKLPLLTSGPAFKGQTSEWRHLVFAPIEGARPLSRIWDAKTTTSGVEMPHGSPRV